MKLQRGRTPFQLNNPQYYVNRDHDNQIEEKMNRTYDLSRNTGQTNNLIHKNGYSIDSSK